MTNCQTETLQRTGPRYWYRSLCMTSNMVCGAGRSSMNAACIGCAMLAWLSSASMGRAESRLGLAFASMALAGSCFRADIFTEKAATFFGSTVERSAEIGTTAGDAVTDAAVEALS